MLPWNNMGNPYNYKENVTGSTVHTSNSRLSAPGVSSYCTGNHPRNVGLCNHLVKKGPTGPGILAEKGDRLFDQLTLTSWRKDPHLVCGGHKVRGHFQSFQHG